MAFCVCRKTELLMSLLAEQISALKSCLELVQLRPNACLFAIYSLFLFILNYTAFSRQNTAAKPSFLTATTCVLLFRRHLLFYTRR